MMARVRVESFSGTCLGWLAWTLVLLAHLILIALFYRGVLPAAMRP